VGLPNLSLPFAGPVSSAFGRRWLVLPGQLGFWNEHEGCDWAGAAGTPVRAAGDGVVYDNVFTSLKGNQLGIQHSGAYRTRYHMLRDKALFKVGQQVHAGDIIGYVGMSGTAATGPHLHFELHYNGKPINPTLTLSYNPAILAGNTSKPFPEKEKEDMPIYELFQLKGDATIWYSVDRISRKPIRNATELADYTNFIKTAGQDATVKQVTSLNSFGEDSSRLSIGEIADAVWAKLIPGTNGDHPAYARLAGADTQSVSKEVIAEAVWSYIIDGFNGKKPAFERLAGIDAEAGAGGSVTLDASAVARAVVDLASTRLAE
jgi:hypothetical protein